MDIFWKNFNNEQTHILLRICLWNVKAVLFTTKIWLGGFGLSPSLMFFLLIFFVLFPKNNFHRRRCWWWKSLWKLTRLDTRCESERLLLWTILHHEKLDNFQQMLRIATTIYSAIMCTNFIIYTLILGQLWGFSRLLVCVFHWRRHWWFYEKSTDQTIFHFSWLNKIIE